MLATKHHPCVSFTASYSLLGLMICKYVASYVINLLNYTVMPAILD